MDMRVDMRAIRRQRIIEEMKRKIRAAYLSRDAILILGEGMTKDLERTTNILFGRLQEWYAIYFPELKLEDRDKFCKVVLAVDKERIDESKRKIIEILGDKGADVAAKLDRSTGIDLTSKDLERIKESAQKVLELSKFKDEIEAYTEGVAREVCPNLAEVGGAKVAAKLVAHAGGIQKLARFPASTIQVLGAEKALFKHLRQHKKPPKHGIIFQHTSVHSSPKELRGRIARALATKLSMAAKVDAYGKKRFIGNELREKFESRLNEILKGGTKKEEVG